MTDLRIIRSFHGVKLFVHPRDKAWACFSDEHPFEPHVVERIRPLLRGKRFLDVGANIGFYSLLAAQEGASRIVAIEPNPETFALLNQSIALHGADVEAHRFGLSDVARFGKMQVEKDNSIGIIKENGNTPVPLVPLSAITGETDFDIVKIDVDGHDFEAARGMADMIERCHPIVFIEFMPSILSDPIGYLTYWKAFGYHFEVLGGSGWWRPQSPMVDVSLHEIMNLIGEQPSYVDVLLTV